MRNIVKIEIKNHLFDCWQLSTAADFLQTDPTVFKSFVTLSIHYFGFTYQGSKFLQTQLLLVIQIRYY